MSFHDEDDADRRFEASRIRQDEHEAELRQRAGCADDCPHDCACVDDMLEYESYVADVNAEFYISRGV